MKKIASKLLKYLSLDPVSKSRIHRIADIEKIGTEYGGCFIPAGKLIKESVCYCAGAGEDISFEIGIAAKYYCSVWIFDPTPRAATHFATLKKRIIKGERMPINNNPAQHYVLAPDILQRIFFIDSGLWDKNEILKFYAPVNPEHVSHSILNLQKTDIFFEARADRLSNIMKKLGHTKLGLLKINIEGAEYKVIDSIIQDNLNIDILCVSFDELNIKLDNEYLHRIKHYIDKLIAFGYMIIKIDGPKYTFVR